ncbi:Protein of unknown function [Propionibacterium freudenreichii]|jgi:hypothetical protein
MM